MKAVFGFLWGTLRAFNHIAAALLLILALVLIIGVMGENAGKVTINVPEKSALVLDFGGTVVEKIGQPDFDDILAGKTRPKEILLRDILAALDHAKDDERITTLVLDLDGYRGAGPASMHAIGAAIGDFREAGKTVIAKASDYGQAQYYLASHADEIWLDPEGSAVLTGYGAFTNFFAGALEKLKTKVHVFKVGTYKSAVEPFVRNDMSDAAKEANLAFLSVLWDSFKADVSRLRGFEPGKIEADIANIVALVEEAQGDLAKMALDHGYVDALKTHVEARKALVEKFGKAANDRGYKSITFANYLKAVNGEPAGGGKDRQIAVVTLRGEIVDGEAETDSIGSDTAIALIDEARTSSRVKALVLRVDSPGGSAFASEEIRQALRELQAAGKPVVASFGSVAASGGYWISATSDEIWAAPETITGSIGIFGLFLTFEDTLGAIGVHTDGIGTTPLANAFDPTRPLSDTVARIIQANIENGYRDFLSLVAEGREMTTEAVDAVAQGRVWAGRTALELGLVDHLGGLEDAIRSAAALAGLEEGEYGVRHIETKLSTFDQFLMNLMEGAGAEALSAATRQGHPLIAELEGQIGRTLERIGAFNDPHGAYLLCTWCEVR